MTLILLVLAILIVVLLILLARNLHQLLESVQSLQARIAALERGREQTAVETPEPEPSSVFAFRPTEVGPVPSPAATSAPPQTAASAGTAASAIPSPSDTVEPLHYQPTADTPRQPLRDDLPLLQEPAAPAGVALDVEVARLRAQGLDRRVIAERLGVSEAEVELVERLHAPRG